MSRKAILAGGSGFIGSAVARCLAADGWEVVVLSRGKASVTVGGTRLVAWDGSSGGAWMREFDGADAVVNFAGRNVNAFPNEANRREILRSRVDAVRILGEAFSRASRRPATWVQCSAVGFYGDRGNQPCTEDAPPGTGFLADVCRQWEEAFTAACPAEVRPVVFRLGLVLGRDGGAFPLLRRLARAGLGGRVGSGRQGVSWVHLDDVAGAIVHAVTHPQMRGIYNLCAPQSVPNAEFMRAIRRAAGWPWSPPTPAFALRLGARLVLRTNPELVLEGQFAPSQRLEQAGHKFLHPQLDGALRELLA